MYKYVKEKYADQLFIENGIRIGTLNWYRDMETKKGISDPLEGSYQDILKVESFNEKDFFSRPGLRENLQGVFSIAENCSNVIIGNFDLVRRRNSPNLLIFCCAHTKSKDLLNEFEGANTCYHIHKPFPFYQLVTWALKQKLGCPVDFLGVFKIDYDEYERTRDDLDSRPLHPALAKTKDFQGQCELRAIWEVPEEFITELYYDLNVIGLRKSCRIVDL